MQIIRSKEAVSGRAYQSSIEIIDVSQLKEFPNGYMYLKPGKSLENLMSRFLIINRYLWLGVVWNPGYRCDIGVTYNIVISTVYSVQWSFVLCLYYMYSTCTLQLKMSLRWSSIFTTIYILGKIEHLKKDLYTYHYHDYHIYSYSPCKPLRIHIHIHMCIIMLLILHIHLHPISIIIHTKYTSIDYFTLHLLSTIPMVNATTA